MGPRYVHHAGSVWRREHCIQYHSYSISENRDLLNAITFAYRDSAAFGSRKAALSLKEGLDQQEGDSDGDVMMRGGSNREWDSAKSDSELFAFTVGAKSVPEND